MSPRSTRGGNRFFLASTALVVALTLAAAPVSAAQGDTIFSRLSGLSAHDQWNGVASFGASVYVAGSRDNIPILRRYNRSGDIIWTRSLVMAGWSQGEVAAVAADESGIYVTGTFLDGGDDQAFVARFQSNATLVWIRQVNAGVRDWTSAIATFGSHIYVTGNYEPQGGGEASFLRRYRLNSKVDWTRTLDGNDDGSLWVFDTKGVAANEDGVYVVGRGLVDNGVTAVVFVRHYDNEGHFPWTDARPIAGLDYATAVAADATGGYVIALANTYDPNTDVATPYGSFLLKYTDGFEWQRRITSRSSTLASGVALSPSGVWITGTAFQRLTGQPGTSADPDGDFFASRYSRRGNPLLTYQYSDPYAQFATGVAADASGVYMSGFAAGYGPTLSSGGADGLLLGAQVPKPKP